MILIILKLYIIKNKYYHFNIRINIILLLFIIIIYFIINFIKYYFDELIIK